MKKTIIAISILGLFLTGCSSTSANTNVGQTQAGITEIKFKDMVAVKELKKLDGQEVKITGFMASSSPLDGSMIYLMNLPYQSCVYCVPNTNQLMNTMAVYPKKGKTIEYNDLPVEIVGTLKFENITDEMGYSYQYRIVDAEVNIADVKVMNEEVKAFTALVDRGFTNAVSNILTEANKILYCKEYGQSYEEMSPIPEEMIAEVDAMFNGLDKSKYTEILSIVEDLKALVDDINSVLESKNYDEMKNLEDKDYEIFYDVYEWLMKAEF